MRALFSSQFKLDLLGEEERYRAISERLRSAFRQRVAGQVREIVKWSGGDHVGPHGFPCRRTKPFPFYVYYLVERDVIYFLALVHERRHPNFLKDRSQER